MSKNYYKGLNINHLYMEDKEDNKKRHEFEDLVINRDITSSSFKSGLENIRM